MAVQQTATESVAAQPGSQQGDRQEQQEQPDQPQSVGWQDFTPDQQAAWLARAEVRSAPPAVLQQRAAAQPAPGAWQAAGQQQRLNQVYQALAVPEMGAEAASSISTQELMSVLEGEQTCSAILIQTALLHSILIKIRQLEKAVHFCERRSKEKRKVKNNNN